MLDAILSLMADHACHAFMDAKPTPAHLNLSIDKDGMIACDVKGRKDMLLRLLIGATSELIKDWGLSPEAYIVLLNHFCKNAHTDKRIDIDVGAIEATANKP